MSLSCNAGNRPFDIHAALGERRNRRSAALRASSALSPLLFAGCLLAAGHALAASSTPSPAPPQLSIMAVQGSEQFSSWAGKVVEVSGLVTRVAASGTGFWLQDGKGDGDPATSDGIYVLVEDAPTPVSIPAVGTLIRVIAEVEEEQAGIALPRTRLKGCTMIEKISGGHPLPDPVVLRDLPSTELADAIAFWEPLEGMRVRVDRGRVVAPTEPSGEFVMVTAADAVPGSGYFPRTHHLLLRSLGEERVDYNPERILVGGDASRLAPVVRPGDEVVTLTGVVDYDLGIYRVLPDTFEVVTHQLPRPPVSERSGEPGQVKVVTYNMRDLFDTIDDPEIYDERFTPTPQELDVQLTKLALSVVVELELPEIIVGNEYESPAIIQALGDRVNAAAGTRYRAASLETSDWRSLEVGFLYDEDRVDLVDYYRMPGADVATAFGVESVFRTREPLVGVFRFSPSAPPLTIIANKFKTKRGEDPRMNVSDHPVRNTEPQRKAQARAVRRFVNSLLAADPNALVIVTGDLGDFQFAEPEEGVDHPIGILEGMGDEVKFTNLIDLEDEAEAFTFIWQGNSMVLSHLLMSPALVKRCVGADILHFNAGFPDHLSSDPSTPLRASDRDPLEARFEFELE
ncbi:MAG: hypothetical protein GY856_24180 [bacterium]|nr:hypothetical protein [bacterium]